MGLSQIAAPHLSPGLDAAATIDWAKVGRTPSSARDPLVALWRPRDNPLGRLFGGPLGLGRGFRTGGLGFLNQTLGFFHPGPRHLHFEA